jgi:hypothetical protein
VKLLTIDCSYEFQESGKSIYQSRLRYIYLTDNNNNNNNNNGSNNNRITVRAIDDKEVSAASYLCPLCDACMYIVLRAQQGNIMAVG